MDGSVGPGDPGAGTLKEPAVSGSLLAHPVIRSLFFERFLVTASATLALAARSVANLVGAQIYVAQGGRPRAFWRLFCPVSSVILLLLMMVAVLLLAVERR